MQVFIAMGSNIDPRVDYLSRAKSAIQRLASPGTYVLCAPLFTSAPVDCPPDAGEFVNTVVAIDWEGEQLIDFLNALQQIEVDLGRDRNAPHPPNAPRTIDLDLLFTQPTTIITHDRLILPHPRMHLRRFVLEPLAVIAPDARPTQDCESVSRMLESLASDEPPLSIIQRNW